MDQGEEQDHEALEETHMGGEVSPLPDHLASTDQEDTLAAGSRGGEEQLGDSHGSQRGSPEVQQDDCEEEEEAKLPCSDISLVKRQREGGSSLTASPSCRAAHHLL
ncbi:zinc finger protein 239-like [Grus japonensis]|uniref:Zinc finger protein 239-like n=1 Tax=Grus japonensis TaxID=30415 RepID=A0ABC9VWS7_GRUJA